MKLRKLFFAVTAMAVMVAHVAQAADGTWTNNAAGNWSGTENWLGGIVADGADFTATLGNVITSDRTITLDTTRVIGNITVSDTDKNYTIASSTLTLDVTTGSPTLSVPSGRTLTISSVVAGSDGFTKTGAGILKLSGNNTYTGGTLINAGTINFGTNSDANLGDTSGGLIFDGTCNITYSDGLVLNVNRTITINGGASVSLANALTVNGILTGSGAFSVNTADAFIFSNANNDFSGTITAATAGSTGYGLDMASIGDGAGAGLINLGITTSGGTFRWIKASGGATTFINRQFALSGTTGGGVISARGASSSEDLTITKDLLITGVGNKTLTLCGTNTGTNTFAGAITNGAGTVISLIKSDAGKWILSGNKTYSGSTTVSAGTFGVVVGDSCSSSAVTVSGGTLSVSVADNTKQWACAGLTHTAAATLEFAFGANTPSATVSPLQVNGDLAFAVAPAVSCTGSSLSAGTYPLIMWTGAFSGVAPSSLTLSSGSGLLVLDTANKTLWLSISGAGSSQQPLTWQGPSGSTWVINEGDYTKWKDAALVSTNYQETSINGTTVGDRVVFGTTGAGTVTLNTTVSPAAVTVNPNTPNNYTISGTGSIAGGGSLTKSGSSILTLSTANSYSGGTLLSAGTLSIGINDALGTGPVVLAGGTIQSSDATDRTLNSPVVLSGSTTVGGTGNLTFTSQGAGSVAAASTLTVNSGLTASIASAMSGSGSITKAGAGTLTLAGTNSYSGTTTVSAGALVIDGGMINSQVIFGANTTLSIVNGGTVNSTGNAELGPNNVSNVGALVLGGDGVTSVWNFGNSQLTLQGYNPPRSNKYLTIDGTGFGASAVVTNISILQWGRTTYDCYLLVTNGGLLSVNSDVQIGSTYYGETGTNNTITIQGGTADSIMTVGQDFYIGYGDRAAASFNTTTVASGGQLTVTRDMYVGHVKDTANSDNPSTGNKLAVTGSGTASMRQLSVGFADADGRDANANLVEVSNGGQLFTVGVSYIGRADNPTSWAHNNSVIVTGTDAQWNAGNQNVYVGFANNATAVSTGNVLTVSAGGMVTNISTLTIKATNTLSLVAGGVVYAGAVVNPGTLAVTIDGGETPACGTLNVTGNLNLNNSTLDVTVAQNPTTPCVIALYGTLTGGFSVTNGLDENYMLDMNYKGENKIAILYTAAGTLIQFK